jgi:hypothetical protein
VCGVEQEKYWPEDESDEEEEEEEETIVDCMTEMTSLGPLINEFPVSTSALSLISAEERFDLGSLSPSRNTSSTYTSHAIG